MLLRIQSATGHATLLLLGAFFLTLGMFFAVRSLDSAGGEPYSPLVRIALLQFYEIILIVTIGFIARRVHAMTEGILLFAIVLSLFFDPTCTVGLLQTGADGGGELSWGQALGVSAACALLLPPKLLLAGWAIRVRVLARTVAALSTGGAIVLFAGLLPSLELPRWTSPWLGFELSWFPLLLAGLVPPYWLTVGTSHAARNNLSGSRRLWLSLSLTYVPLLLVALHLMRLSRVVAGVSPEAVLSSLFLGLCLLTVRNSLREMPHLERSILVDALVVCGFLAGGGCELAEEAVSSARIMAASLPVIQTGIAALLIYILFGWRLRYRPAFYRIGPVLAIMCFAALLTAGQAAVLWGLLRAGARAAAAWMGGHPWVPIHSAFLALLVLRLLRPNGWWRLGTWTFGVLSIACWLPGSAWEWAWEWGAATVVGCTWIVHRESGLRMLRPWFVVTAGILCSGWMMFDPCVLSVVSLLVVLACFEACGVVLNSRLHRWTAVAMGAAGGAYWLAIMVMNLDPLLLTVGGAVALYGLGCLLVLKEASLRRWIENRYGRGEAEAPGDSGEEDWKSAGGKSPAQPTGAAGWTSEAGPWSDGARCQAAVPASAGEEVVSTPRPHAGPDVIPITDVRRFLESIFITNPRNGIYVVKDLPHGLSGDFLAGAGLEEGEELVVYFEGVWSDGHPWCLLMTDRRVLFRRNDGEGLVGVRYEDIERLERHLGSLIFVARSGLVFWSQGLSVTQAIYLKMGLESLAEEFSDEEDEGTFKEGEKVG